MASEAAQARASASAGTTAQPATAAAAPAAPAARRLLLFAFPLALLVALPAGGIALLRGFDGLYGQDAYAYFDYASGPLRAAVLRLEPPPPFFWPPGYPLLVTLTSLLIGVRPLAGQAVSLSLGALVPVLTVALADALAADWLVALTAGVLVATCGQLWQSSFVVMADTAGLALAVLGMLGVARYLASDRLAWLALGSAALSGAVLCRWIYVVLALPIAAVFALSAGQVVAAQPSMPTPGASRLTPTHTSHRLTPTHASHQLTPNHTAHRLPPTPGSHQATPTQGARPITPSRGARPTRPARALAHAAIALLIALTVLAPVLGPGVLGLLREPTTPAAFAGNFQVYSWSPLNALRRDFATVDGILSYTWPNGVYYAVAPANTAFFGPLLALLILPGSYAAWRAWSRQSLVLVLGWAALVYAFHAGAPWQNFRFALAYLPPLAIVAALGLRWTMQRVDRRLVLAYAGLGVAIATLGAVRTSASFIDRATDEQRLVQWVETQIPPNAQLLTFGPTLAFQHRSTIPTLDLDDLAPQDLARVITLTIPSYVLVDEASLATQWRDLPPGQNLAALRTGPGLSPVGSRGSYRLYRVNST